MFLAVDFTDGRTTFTQLFDPNGDTEQSAAELTTKLAQDGWVPVVGSQRMVPKRGFAAPADPKPHFLERMAPAIFRAKRHAIEIHWV